MANENEQEQECCADWLTQIEKINNFIIIQSIRAGRDLYDGVKFRFCPWCGKERPKGKRPSTTISVQRGA